jgi:hypothetical protein
MDPISMIVMALVTGAAAALKPMTEQTIKDAYAGVKGLIQRKYRSVNVTMLEADPASKSRQDVIKEDLEKTNAKQDEELLHHSQALLDAIQTHAPDVPRSVGIDLKDIKVATSLNVGMLLAEGNATAFRGERMDVGSLSFGDVEARSGEDTPPKKA